MRRIMIGDNPIDGSSSMSSRGRHIQGPADGQHLLLAPRQGARGLGPPLAQHREPLEDPLQVAGDGSRPVRAGDAPRSRFSCTVIRGKMRRPSGEWAMPRSTISWAATWSMRSPSNQISPAVGHSSPDTVRNTVVLPAPLLPMRVTRLPASTENGPP